MILVGVMCDGRILTSQESRLIVPLCLIVRLRLITALRLVVPLGFITAIRLVVPLGFITALRLVVPLGFNHGASLGRSARL